MRLYTRYKPLRPSKKAPPGSFALVLFFFFAALASLAWWFAPAKEKTAALHPRSVAVAVPSSATSSVRPTRVSQEGIREERRTVVPTFPQATLPAEPNLAKAVTAEIHGVEEPRFAPRSVENIFEAQVALARRGFSSGSIDGLAGGQTKAALLAFQKAEGLPITGALDAETGLRLLLSIPPLTEYFLTSGDLARLQPLGRTWLEKSQQMALEHESALEFISEKFYSHPTLIRRLNPSVNWTEPGLNAAITVPNVEKPPFKNKAAWIRIELRRKILQAFDSETNLLVHFPCSIAQKVDKRPVGELHVAVLAPNPNYLFDPENFPESTEARELNRKLMLPPGPNNPVGTAWIGLDRPGYGIHGTPKPEEVGRTESHGCFRLANWNAEHLLRLVSPGVPVLVEP